MSFITEQCSKKSTGNTTDPENDGVVCVQIVFSKFLQTDKSLGVTAATHISQYLLPFYGPWIYLMRYLRTGATTTLQKLISTSAGRSNLI